MKKLKFFMCNLIVIAALCTLFTSCSESDDFISPNTSIGNSSEEKPGAPLTPVSKDKHFWSALDSINHIHKK